MKQFFTIIPLLFLVISCNKKETKIESKSVYASFGEKITNENAIAKEVLLETLVDFIEGNLVKNDKKKCAESFYNNYLRWKNDKDNIITEAIFKAAVHYGLIYFDKGKYVTKAKNTILGSDEKESIDLLLEARNISELKDLKTEVETKLSK